ADQPADAGDHRGGGGEPRPPAASHRTSETQNCGFDIGAAEPPASRLDRRGAAGRAPPRRALGDTHRSIRGRQHAVAAARAGLPVAKPGRTEAYPEGGSAAATLADSASEPLALFFPGALLLLPRELRQLVLHLEVAVEAIG